jgi:hypothetical protein
MLQDVEVGLEAARHLHHTQGDFPMAKKSRGGRMTAAKKRAAKRPGGKGPVKKRKVGRKIMKT